MTDALADLARALHQMSQIIGDVRPDQADTPTPCHAWTAHDLVSHVVHGLDKFITSAHGERPDWSQTAPSVEGDWQAAFDRRSPELIKAWRKIDDLDTPIQSAIGNVPAGFLISQQTAELTVHAWDLATATGQTLDWDDEVATHALAWARGALKPEYRGNDKAFGPEQPAPPDATPTEALAAFFGRTVA